MPNSIFTPAVHMKPGNTCPELKLANPLVNTYSAPTLSRCETETLAMEKIQITGLSVEAYIGVPQIERDHPQSLLIDLTLEADFSKAVLHDEFSQTIDYLKVVEKVKRAVASRPFSLIEGLAGNIAELILTDSRVETVHVRVRKFPASLVDHVQHISFELTRTR